MTEVNSSPRSAPDAIGDVWTVHHRDARATEDFLSRVALAKGYPGRPFLTATITSPPYANLVDYGTEGQIGFGQSLDAYLDECAAIFRSIFGWTRSDGCMWLVADTLLDGRSRLSPSPLLPLPFALAERASQAGWTLRDVVIWRKDRTRPWSTGGRLRNGFEYVLFFVKTNKFKHRVERLRDVRGLKRWWVKYPERHNPWGMVPDNVWDIPIPVQGSWATSELRHACPLPAELVRRMVLLSTDEGDVVFDPFAGSGMVPAVSESESRLPLGTELNETFCAIYRDHVRPMMLKSAGATLDVDADDLTGTLLSLRVLKYPKDLIRQLMRTGVPRESLIAALVTADPYDMTPRTSAYAKATCVLYVRPDMTDDGLQDIRDRIQRAQARPPLSKYGLTTTVAVVRAGNLRDDSASRRLAAYYGGRTWKAAEWIEPERQDDWISSLTAAGQVPPIVSPIYVEQELEDN